MSLIPRQKISLKQLIGQGFGFTLCDWRYMAHTILRIIFEVGAAADLVLRVRVSHLLDHHDAELGELHGPAPVNVHLVGDKVVCVAVLSHT